MGQQINILIVFLLTGLWHGFSANFVIWGLLQGGALIFEASSWGRKLRASRAPLQHLYALGVILVGWVFFRSPSLSFAWMYLGRLFGNTSGVGPIPFELTSPLPFIEPTFVIALVAGLIFSLPVDRLFEGLHNRLAADKILPSLAFRFVGDVMLTLILLVSIAAMAGSAFMPGIYELF
jgi:alginate O-acetyltransferase complex protein AlgI